MQSTMMNYPLTLIHLLERAGRYFPRAEIVSRLPDGSIHRSTYRDFHRRAKALAEALTQAAGLKRGDRVATLMWNHYAHLEAFFGIPAAGGVVHTLNLRLAPDDIAYIANHAEDRFLIVDDALLPLLERFKDRARFERNERAIAAGDGQEVEFADHRPRLPKKRALRPSRAPPAPA